jgi:RecA/RadA recombinase
MAKKKKATATMEDIYSQLAKDTGGDVLADISPVKGFIDTANLAFNYACSGRFIGGGVPRGRIIEIYGPSSSGKSLWASHIIHGCQQIGGWVILLDVENAADTHFMKEVLGVNTAQLVRHGPERVETLEKCFHMMHDVTRKIRMYEKENGIDPRPITIVYDSIASSPCARELKETELPFDYKVGDWKRIVGGKEQPGERAKICSRELRKLNPMVAENDVCLIILNQVREKIGVMWGNPETTGGGGRALEFYSSLRVRMQSKKKIENKRLETFAGINLAIKNVKNRTFRPFVEADDIKLYFDKGVDPLSGLLRCLLQDERIKMKTAGNYFVLPDYLPEGVDECKFKASKAANTVKLDVLLACPKLVDVETKEEVEEYLSEFKLGMEASASDDYEEKDVSFDIDGNPLD